ncbi:MAG: energy transducer TonB, partial [Pedobacter sp.]
GDGGSGGGSGGGTGSGNGTGTGPGSGSGSGGGSGAGRGTGVGNYQLAGRKVLAKPQPRYTCNEQGTVVVEISVDKDGRVTGAQAGVRGTTNSAKCLLDQAKDAALKTKFDSSDSAPEKQVGKIVYNFKLTE